MSTYDDVPLDLAGVAADDALVEQLRRALDPSDAVVWGDDDDSEDASYALLRALQHEVSAELPDPRFSEVVLPLVRGRRALRRSATVAVVTAGVLSLAGAAAAGSSPGDRMYGVRSAVAAAVSDVIDVITPGAADGTNRRTPSATTPLTSGRPGLAVSTAARAAVAARLIEERLATADRLLDSGRPRAAGEVLDQAERRLPLVDAVKRAAYALQITALRDRAADLSVVLPGREGREDRRGASGEGADGDATTTTESGSGDDSRGAEQRRPDSPQVGADGLGERADGSGSRDASGGPALPDVAELEPESQPDPAGQGVQDR